MKCILAICLLIFFSGCNPFEQIPGNKKTNENSTAVNSPRRVTVLTATNTSTPKVRIDGNFLVGQTVFLHTNASCTAPVGSSAVTNTSFVIITSTPVDVDVVTKFYANVQNRKGIFGPCSSVNAFYTYKSLINPLLVSVLTAQSKETKPEVLIQNALIGADIYLYIDSTCSGTVYKSYTGTARSTFATALDVDLPSDASYKFYAKQKLGGDWGPCSSPSSAYTLDRSLTSISVLGGITGAETTPTIRVDGTIVGDTANPKNIQLFSNSSCTNAISTLQTITGPLMDITLNPLSQDGTYNIYAKQTAQLCSSKFATYTLSTIPGNVSVITTSPSANTRPTVKVSNLLSSGAVNIFVHTTSTPTDCSTSTAKVLTVTPAPFTTFIQQEITQSIDSTLPSGSDPDNTYYFFANQVITTAYTSPCSLIGSSYTLATNGKKISSLTTTPAATSTIVIRAESIDDSATEIKLYNSKDCTSSTLIETATKTSGVVWNYKDFSVDLATSVINPGNIALGNYYFSYSQDTIGCSGSEVYATYTLDTAINNIQLVEQSGPEIYPQFKVSNIVTTGSTISVYLGEGCNSVNLVAIATPTTSTATITVSTPVTTANNYVYSFKQEVSGFADSCSSSVGVYDFDPAPSSLTFTAATILTRPKFTIEGIHQDSSINLYPFPQCLGSAIAISEVSPQNGDARSFYPAVDNVFFETENYPSVKVTFPPLDSSLYSECITVASAFTINSAITSVSLAPNQASSGNQIRPILQVGGTLIDAILEIYNNSSCSGSPMGTKHILTEGIQNIQLNALSNIGNYKFYAKQIINANAGTPYSSSCSTQYASYSLDLTPTSIQNVSISTTLFPTFEVSGIVAGALVGLYKNDPNCSLANIIGIALANGNSVLVNVSNENPLTDNSSYSIYANQTLNGVASSCSTNFATYLQDTIPLSLEITAPTPTTIAHSDLNPSIKVSGTVPGAIVNVFRDSSCSILIASTSTTSTETSLVAGDDSFPSDGIYTLYANQIFNGHLSPCSSSKNRYTQYTINSNISFSNATPTITNYDYFIPTFELKNTTVGFSVSLHSNSSCNSNSLIASPITVTASTTTIAVNSGALAALDSYSIYARHYKGNFAGSCSSIPFIYNLDLNPNITLSEQYKNVNGSTVNIGADPTPNLHFKNLQKNSSIDIFADSTCSDSGINRATITVSNTDPPTLSTTDFSNATLPISGGTDVAILFAGGAGLTTEAIYNFSAKVTYGSLISQCFLIANPYTFDKTVRFNMDGYIISDTSPTFVVSNIDPNAITVKVYKDICDSAANLVGTSQFGIDYDSSEIPTPASTITVVASTPIYAGTTFYAKQDTSSKCGSVSLTDNFKLQFVESEIDITIATRPIFILTPAAIINSASPVLKNGEVIRIYTESSCSNSNNLVAAATLTSNVTSSSLQVDVDKFEIGREYNLYFRRTLLNGVNYCTSSAYKYQTDFTPILTNIGAASGTTIRPLFNISNLVTANFSNPTLNLLSKFILYEGSSCKTKLSEFFYDANTNASVSSSADLAVSNSSATIRVPLLTGVLAGSPIVKTYSVKQVTTQGSTSECSIPGATYTIDLSPLIVTGNTTQSTPIFSVELGSSGSPLLNGATISLYAGTSCAVPSSLLLAQTTVTNSDSVTLSTLPLPIDGAYDIRAIQSKSGITSACSGNLTLTLDTAPSSVTALTFQSNNSTNSGFENRSSQAFPKFLVRKSNLNSKISLYTNNTCSATHLKGSNFALSDELDKLLVNPDTNVKDGVIVNLFPGMSASDVGTKKIYAKKIDNFGISTESACSTAFANYTFDSNKPAWQYSHRFGNYSAGISSDNYGGGLSVAKQNNNIIAIGTPGKSGNTGAVKVFKFNGYSWDNIPVDTTALLSAGDLFGSSLDLYLGASTTTLNNNSELIVGAPGDSSNDGKVYVFNYNPSTNVFENPTEIDPPVSSSQFGFKAKRHSSGIYISAPLANTDGAVYYYSSKNDTIPDSYVFANSGGGDLFGQSIDVDGNYLIVGAPGSDKAYLYLTTNASTSTAVYTGTSGTQFGWSVSIDDNQVVVGAPLDDDNGADAGEAFYYSPMLTASAIELSSKLPNSTLSAGDNFGWSVSIDGTTLLVSAPFSDLTFSNSGSAYVLKAPNFTHIQRAQDLLNGQANDFFGYNIFLEEDTILIQSASGDVNDSGAVYLYKP